MSISQAPILDRAKFILLHAYAVSKTFSSTYLNKSFWPDKLLSVTINVNFDRLVLIMRM